MAKRWTNYDGPTVGFVIDHGQPRPLTDLAALENLSKTALLAGLGSSQAAAEYHALVFAAEHIAS